MGAGGDAAIGCRTGSWGHCQLQPLPLSLMALALSLPLTLALTLTLTLALTLALTLILSDSGSIYLCLSGLFGSVHSALAYLGAPQCIWCAAIESRIRPQAIEREQVSKEEQQ